MPRLLTPLLLVFVLASAATAQRPRLQRQATLSDTVKHEPPPAPRAPAAPVARPARFDGIAYQDTVAMLVVFVRFQDDTWGDCARRWCHLPDWPHIDLFGTRAPVPWTQLPDWAPTLLETTPEAIRADRLTLADSSLSAYFYWQSRAGPNGPHILYGHVWPEVYLSRRPAAAYRNRRDSAGVALRQPGGYGYLAEELLDDLTAQGLDLGHYDHNRDGVLDHLMMIVRRDSLFDRQGWASLAGNGGVYGVPDQNNDRRPDTLRYWSPARGDSIRVDWAHSGSQNIAHERYRKLLIHEYGHRLFDMGGHLALVPFDPNDPRACGYARMCGVPNQYDASALTLSAHERRRMGWLDPQILTPSAGDRLGVTLHDLYTSGDAVFIPLGQPGDTLTVANRQPVGFFDEERSLTRLARNFDVIYEGLATRGLHIALSRGEPRGSRYAYGMIPADGVYDRTNRCSGSHESCLGPDTYDGDFFGPETMPQLAPWTRPTSSGLARADRRPDDTAPAWFALDAMRYASGDPATTMQFDYIADVRRRPNVLSPEAPWPVFRADAWLGPDFDGLVFTSEALAESGVTVYLGADDVLSDSTTGRHTSLGPVRLTFAEGLRLEPGTRLIIGPEADVTIGRGVLGGPGVVLVMEPGAQVTLGPDVRMEGVRLEGEPDEALRRRFRER